MSIFIWCLVLSVVICDTSFGIPTTDFKTDIDSSIRTNLREKKQLIHTQLNELIIWSRNSLNLIRTVAKAIQRSLSTEFGIQIQLKESSSVFGKNLLWKLYSFCGEIQRYTDTMKSALPLVYADRTREFSEVYIYRSVFDTLKSTLSTLRSFAGQIILSYNYYMPEITLTQCLGRYLQHSYPSWISRTGVVYPMRFVQYIYDWTVEFVRTFGKENTLLEFEHRYDRINNNTRKLYGFGKNRENEVDANELFLPRSRDYKVKRSLQFDQSLLALFNFDDVIGELLGLGEQELKQANIAAPTKCIQNYVLEAMWDRLEKYLS